MNINLNTDDKPALSSSSLSLESKIITKNDMNKSTSFELSNKNVRKKLNNNRVLVEKEHKRVIKHTREFDKKTRSKSVTFFNVNDNDNDNDDDDDDDENKVVISGNGYIIRGSKEQVYSSLSMPESLSSSNSGVKMTRSLDNININSKNDVKFDNSGNLETNFRYVTEITINIDTY
jgi:hypothetical protein